MKRVPLIGRPHSKARRTWEQTPLIAAARRLLPALALAQASDPLPSWNDGPAGIEKGKPFAPDEGMKKILTEAAAVGDPTAGAVAFHMRDRDDYYYW